MNCWDEHRGAGKRVYARFSAALTWPLLRRVTIAAVSRFPVLPIPFIRVSLTLKRQGSSEQPLFSAYDYHIDVAVSRTLYIFQCICGRLQAMLRCPRWCSWVVLTWGSLPW